MSGVVRASLAALPVALALPWQCALEAPRGDADSAAVQNAAVSDTRNRASGSGSEATEPSQPSAATAKQEAPVARVSSASRPPARPLAISLADEVVVKALSVGQPAFLRCWARAQRVDALDATKVRLHIELDAAGHVTACHSDTGSPTLARCLTVVARQLPFPAPGVPAVVDLPLMFR